MADTLPKLDGDRSTRRTQLPEEVASYVRELIISGAVRPGTFLRLEPIAEAVGVSNTPVREGLLALRSEGFVQLVPRRGFVVAPFSRQDVRDIFWAQAHLAGELCARAAEQITPETVIELETCLAKYEKAYAAGDRERMVRLGHDFHRAINLASGSHRLALVLGTVTKQLPNRFYASIDGDDATHEEHPALLAALKAGDPVAARSLMEHHISSRAEHLIDALEQQGLWRENESSAS